MYGMNTNRYAWNCEFMRRLNISIIEVKTITIRVGSTLTRKWECFKKTIASRAHLYLAGQADAVCPQFVGHYDKFNKGIYQANLHPTTALLGTCSYVQHPDPVRSAHLDGDAIKNASCLASSRPGKSPVACCQWVSCLALFCLVRFAGWVCLLGLLRYVLLACFAFT